MDVPDDETVTECLHGVAEDIPADGLHDILHELRTVGFYAFPFLGGAYPFIGDGFSAELVLAHPGLHIGEKPAGWKPDEEHTALVEEFDSKNICLYALCDSGLYRTVNIPPEGGDHWVGSTLGIHEGLKFFFR